MKNMMAFYSSLPDGHPVLKARVAHSKANAEFEDDGGIKLPGLFAAITRLRSELEQVANPPPIVGAYIDLLDSDIPMMKAIEKSIKGAK